MLFICDIGVDLFIEGGLGGQILSVRMDVCFYVIYTWVRACKLLFMFFYYPKFCIVVEFLGWKKPKYGTFYETGKIF